MPSTAEVIAQILCSKLNKNTNGTFTNFLPAVRGNQNITINAKMVIQKVERDVSFQFCKDNLLVGRIKIPGWTNVASRAYAEFHYTEFYEADVRGCLLQLHEDKFMKKLSESEFFVKLLLDQCSYNLQRWHVELTTNTISRLLFKTNIPGMNEEGDSLITLPLNDVFSIRTAAPSRPGLDRGLLEQLNLGLKRIGYL